MGTCLKAEPNNRKRYTLAVLALLLVMFVTFPLIAEAAPASPTPNIQPSATASPTEPATTPSPTPVASEITIQKESNSKWWIVYPPDGKKVAFESVATYRFSSNTNSSWFQFEVVDKESNVLPIKFEEAVVYMRSKGLWETADRDKAEKDWWDKVTGFLDDIWNGVNDGVDILAKFWEALLTGQLLGLFVASITTIIGDGLGELVLNIISYADSTELLFRLPVGQILVGFSRSFGFMLWVIGFIIATGEIAINLKSNRVIRDSLHDYGMNMFKSFLAITFFTIVPVPLYTFVSKIASIICYPILQSAGNVGRLDFNNLSWDMTPSDLMVLIFFVALLFSGLKVLFSFVKRGGVLMILILVGSVHMINLPRGYWDSFWSWCRQVIALCITQFCQMALFCTGISIFLASQQTSFSLFLAGISLTLAAAEVPRIAERYGMDTSLKGNAASAIQSVATAARMIVFKK